MSAGLLPGHAETVLTDCVSGCNITDVEREVHIKICGERMTKPYAAYKASGGPADRKEAQCWLAAMADAIRSRSAKTVARMELEKGLM